MAYSHFTCLNGAGFIFDILGQKSGLHPSVCFFSAFLATCVSAESVVRAQASENALMATWKWGSDDPQAFFEGGFVEGWQLLL